MAVEISAKLKNFCYIYGKGLFGIVNRKMNKGEIEYEEISCICFIGNAFDDRCIRIYRMQEP